MSLGSFKNAINKMFKSHMFNIYVSIVIEIK